MTLQEKQLGEKNRVQLLSKNVVVKIKGDPSVEVKRNNR